MSQSKNSDNVIQFPGANPSTPVRERRAPVLKKKQINLKTIGAFVAIAMASGAVNRYAFRQTPEDSMAIAGLGSARTIASVRQGKDQRDATWEKNLAESLASPNVRSIASTHIGHTASLEDRLRWGTLEHNYTILKPNATTISVISLQDKRSNPAYVLNREMFLDEYGSLLSEAFHSAKLKSVELEDDRVIESYTLFNKLEQPMVEVLFQLDSHKRLLSLTVEPIQI